MELKDWITSQLTEFERLIIRMENLIGFLSSIDSYDKLVNLHGETVFLFCYAEQENFRYYIGWDNGIGYIFKVLLEETEYADPEFYFQNHVFKNDNWKDRVLEMQHSLLDDCSDCLCYNDKLVSGWCYGKHNEIGIKSWT